MNDYLFAELIHPWIPDKDLPITLNRRFSDKTVIKKQATTFKDFIAEGGALNIKQLITEGFDAEIFKNNIDEIIPIKLGK